MKFIHLMLGFFIFSCASQNDSTSPPISNTTATYKVTIQEDKKIAFVEAEFSLESDVIYTYISFSNDLKNGSSDLMQNLIMTDATTGKKISINSMFEGDWKTSGHFDQRVKLTYEVILSHERYHWESGIDEVSFVRDDGVFFKNTSLFIIPGEQLTDIFVEFHLPKNWIASTPWKKVDNQKFQTTGWREFMLNCLFVGTHHEELVRVDDFQLLLAIGGSQKQSVELFKQTMTSQLNAYLDLFGKSPSNYYLIVLHDDKQSDGGAFRSSFSQVIDGVANNGSKIVWAHTMGHEIFHLWNGNSMIPDGQEEWFKEGFTDYMTIKYMNKLQTIPPSDFYKIIENTYRKYVIFQLFKDPKSPQVSIRESGSEKGKNRLLVYGGGSLIAFMLDIEMRQATQHTASVDLLMVHLFQEFGHHKKRFTLQDIIRITNQLTQKDFTTFFEQYVIGNSTLPIKDYLKKVGLQMDTFVEEIYISPDPNATDEQKKLFKEMFTY